MINARFGTWRGLIRLGLAHGQVLTGRAGERPADSAAVTRLVFVCHGNICRSAFADVLATNLGVRSASFGLSTSSGSPAHQPALVAASALGVDLAAHKTTRMEDFAAMPGDLLMAMEVRHLHRLVTIPALAEFPRSLLGQWATPPVPHLHDPYQLDPRYMLVCLERIQQAVTTLSQAFPGARL